MDSDAPSSAPQSDAATEPAGQPRRVSILVPCFNEAQTLRLLLEQVEAADAAGLEKEIIVIDDASTDDSIGIARELEATMTGVRVIAHEANRGKGAAIRTGIEAATGDVVLIQDADLEYDPGEYGRLLAPILAGHADVVFGSRFRGGESIRVLYFWHSLGNRFLTLLSNMLTDLNLSDMETCYKVFRRDIATRINLNEDRFGFEPEFTAKISRLRPRPAIYEVGISYQGRTYEEGKKITWRDGIRALYCIVRYNLFA